MAAVRDAGRIRGANQRTMAGAVPGTAPSFVLPSAIAAAWLVILVAQATGTAGAFHHHALIEGGPPLWLAIPMFLAAWQVMVAAMMLPASLPAYRAVEAAAEGLTHPRRIQVTFLTAFALVWAAFGLLAFLGDFALHHVVDTTPWLAARPWLIEAGILALAGGYQFVPLKRRSLAACRHPAVAAFGPAGPEFGGATTGFRHGIACLGTSWALMLLMFGQGFASLGWMVALTAAMAGETTGRHGRGVAAATGIVLLSVALATLGIPAAGAL